MNKTYSISCLIAMSLLAGCGGALRAEPLSQAYHGQHLLGAGSIRSHGAVPGDVRSGTEGSDPVAAAIARFRDDRRATDPELLRRDASFRLGDAGIDDPYSSGFQALANDPLAPSRPVSALSVHREAGVRRMLRTAASYVGAPYEYGSDREDPATFDASDYTRWVLLTAIGIDLPRDSRSQAEYVRSRSSRLYTDIRDAMPGDLLFFSRYRGTSASDYAGGEDPTITHTGIALGGSKMIHTASERTGGVRVDDVTGNHFEWRFVFGGSALD